MDRADHRQPRVMHCDCGEIREVSAGISILACVRCGRAMHAPRPPERPIPSHMMVTGAAALVELLCASAFTLGVLWILKTGDTSARAIAVAAIAAFGMLAGAMAYRGSVAGLIASGGVIAAIAMACSTQTATVGEMFVLAKIVPQLVGDPAQLVTIAGGVALIALGVVICALPQARRLAAWQRERLDRAFALPG